MNVRKAKPEDYHAIEELHRRMGFNYLLPNFEAKPALVTEVAANGRGLVAAVHFRKEAEAYLWLDLTASSRARWDAITALDRESSEALRHLGLRDEVAWIPRQIEDGFAHALVKLGFRRARPEFSAWSKEL